MFIAPSILYAQVHNADVDMHELCEFWASSGECEANPNYMLHSCKKSCGKVVQPIPNSFYDIVEKDIDGNDVNFEQFRRKLVYIVNVASQCGYTTENYRMLQRLSRYRSDNFEILIFPCNQFGAQEPGSEDDIKDFASKRGFGGIVMSKGDVKGVNTRPTFRFLKSRTPHKEISW
jgi:glutathione peroxidase-family protein